jgi:hypothetical protein
MEALEARLRGHMSSSHAPVWCIFDNTALGAATANAIDLIERLANGRPSARSGDRSGQPV